MARTSHRARRSSPLNLPGAFELFTPSKAIVLKNIWIFAPLFGAVFLLGILSWSLTPADVTTPWFAKGSSHGPVFTSLSTPVIDLGNFGAGVPFLWAVFALAASFILQIMTQKAQLDSSSHQDLIFSRLWGVVRQLGWRLVGLYIVIGVVTMIGFILLIIPGIIMLRRYSLAPYVMMDKKTGIRESMDISAAITKPYSGSIYRVLGVIFLIALLALIPIIGWLVSLVLGMLYTVALALRYQQLKSISREG